MEFFLLLIMSPVGLIVGGIGLAEVLEERRFKRAAIRVKGNIIGKVSARYTPRVQFNGFGSHTGVTESTDVRSMAGYIGVIEFTTKDGYVYQVKTQQMMHYDENEEVEVLYSSIDSRDVMIDSYYKVGKEKYYRLYGGMIFILIPIVLIIIRILM